MLVELIPLAEEGFSNDFSSLFGMNVLAANSAITAEDLEQVTDEYAPQTLRAYVANLTRNTKHETRKRNYA